MREILNSKTHRIATALPTLDGCKTAKVDDIKREAFSRISALDWKVTREAELFDLSGGADRTALDAVLNERNAIRAASDQAEIDVMALSTVEEVEAFAW